ncbi:hypothetical protein AURDEDRAFT_175437 [Auricularia subglabra TFB-10046 SS5]|uniref:MYND-type domain-containing protein n=1 Tax=Auricularia subglabra (strain TFB-10046 / SS5) TaxID=717982 RepID=J0WRX7_AURST|nr:hypothetical protein AURDEDRAFT_175437 [Auricularia subglabra TFB-10046 SS5]
MSSPAAIIKTAESIASGLRPVTRPKACPRCITSFMTGTLLKDPTTVIPLLQTKCHDFWDALLGFVAYPWTPDTRLAVSGTLQATWLRCRSCHPGRRLVQRGTAISDFPFNGIYEVACTALYMCITGYTMSSHRHEKGFGSKRGRWPCTVEQLFPYGPQSTITNLVSILATRPEADFVLSAMLTVHRPLALPSFSSEENKQRIIAHIISRLNAAAAAANVDLSALRAPVLPSARDATVNRHTRACEFSALIIYQIGFGTDREPRDLADFVRGHGLELFHALDGVVSLYEDPENTHIELTQLTTTLWTYLSLSPSAAQAGPAPPYARRWVNRLSSAVSSPYSALRHFLGGQTMRRDCHGPGCGKGVHAKDTPGAFSRCARCRVVQYCSKECQKADWRDPAFPHKELCPLLQEVFSFANTEMTHDEFAAACEAHKFPLKHVDRLISWCSPSHSSYNFAEGAIGRGFRQGKYHIVLSCSR